MLHTKFGGNRPAASGEEDFWSVFTIYGRGGHLGHVTSIMSSDFHSIVPESFHKKIGSRLCLKAMLHSLVARRWFRPQTQ